MRNRGPVEEPGKALGSVQQEARAVVCVKFCKSGSRLTAVVSAGLVEIATRGRSDLSIFAPGRCAARMPGTGPLRRSSAAARKKAIVDKSRFGAGWLQRPRFVFRDFWKKLPIFLELKRPPVPAGGAEFFAVRLRLPC